MSEILTKMGSYPEKDVTFLLKDLSSISIEKTTDERERAIQNGVHYSEMLPIEYKPTDEYMKLFYESLNQSKQKVAVSVGVTAERIIENKGFQIVLCSLARAGTPVGILLKRYIDYKYKKDVPHYSISIIRDKGIDENAVQYIQKQHPTNKIVFVDGWTGKGAITKELNESIALFNEKYGMDISSELAVLADPGFCSTLYGTREDFLIPSACLNSTVSGLVSRTVLHDEWISENDFHGAKYYEELIEEDVSNLYVDIITNEFNQVEDQVEKELTQVKNNYQEPSWEGLRSIQRIQTDFDISNTHLIKPGVGETTRVLLRRVPWKILMKPDAREKCKHILLLAEDRGVPVVDYQNMSYSCCGLIHPLENTK